MPTTQHQPITREQLQTYINTASNSCPRCGSTNITGGFVEVDDRSAWQPVSCDECSAEWQDVYHLVAVETHDPEMFCLES